MNRKVIIGIVVSIILLIIAGATIFISSGGSEIDKKIELANKYIREGKYEEARLAFEEILKIDENNVEARLGLSKAYVGLEDYVKAEEVLRKGIAIDDKQVAFWDALIELCKERGKIDEELVKLLAEAYDKTGDEKYSKMREEYEAKLSGESSAEVSDESNSSSGEGETDTNSEDVNPLDDPEKVISFVDPVFEQAVRDLYNLGDGEIRWKDIGYRTELSFSNWETNYVELAGAIKSLEDLKWFRNLERVEINCYRNGWEVSGNIAVLGDLKNLRIINLSPTKVSGDLSVLSDLNKLTYISISESLIIGDLKDLLGLRGLEGIDLYYTDTSGDIAELTNLPNLIHIGLSGAKVSGDIASLNSFNNMQHIYLARTGVYGSIDNLSNLKNLKHLIVDGTGLEGDVSKFKNLEVVDIDDTNITGVSSLVGVKIMNEQAPKVR